MNVNLKNQRRMAAQILKCGENRVWMDPNRLEDIEDSITRADIRTLIASGTIAVAPEKGVSRGRARHAESQKAKGRRKGHGSRKGTANARRPTKKHWEQTIRALRRRLREHRDEGRITKAIYREYYRKAKGGMFRNIAHLDSHLKTEGHLKEG
ncbi:MAG: 50S ribosomal protein L19e [Thermoplasmata archaeon]